MVHGSYRAVGIVTPGCEQLGGLQRKSAVVLITSPEYLVCVFFEEALTLASFPGPLERVISGGCFRRHLGDVLGVKRLRSPLFGAPKRVLFSRPSRGMLLRRLLAPIKAYRVGLNYHNLHPKAYTQYVMHSCSIRSG